MGDVRRRTRRFAGRLTRSRGGSRRRTSISSQFDRLPRPHPPLRAPPPPPLSSPEHHGQTVSDKTSGTKDEQISGDIQLRDAKRGEWVR